MTDPSTMSTQTASTITGLTEITISTITDLSSSTLSTIIEISTFNQPLNESTISTITRISSITFSTITGLTIANTSTATGLTRLVVSTINGISTFNGISTLQFYPSTLQPFPGQNSIPPASFYTMQGLATWLNQNPSYKYFFINYPRQFPGLSSMNPTLSSIGYDAQYVPLSPQVTTMSYNQMQQYKEQLQVFQRVYEFNSNAYVTSLTSGPPIYYSFNSYQELMTYKASVAFINKLYPFRAMARGKTDFGQMLGWIVPFPL